MSQNIEFPLPEDFINRIRSQLSDYDIFQQSVDQEAGTSIRLNPTKIKKDEDEVYSEKVPWNNLGRYLESRPKFSQDPLYHAGLYYPMEASSMFLDYALKQIKLVPDALMLDLCAAPGGKSLILKDSYPEQFLLSNEIDSKRVHVLKENAIRWGTKNHLVIQSDAARLQKSDLKFDLIVVDAPCSGEGLFRKDKKSRTEWSLEKATGCAMRQQDILEDTLPLLAADGWLIYSTCTFNPEENLERVQQLMDAGLEIQEIPIDDQWGIEKVTKGEALGYQFWPHKVHGEGFFISILKATGEPEEKVLETPRIKNERFDHLKDLNLEDLIVQKADKAYMGLTITELEVAHALKKCGNIVKRGIMLGEEKGKDFIPAHDLSSQDFIKDFPNQLELSIEQSLEYLKGNALPITHTKGPVLLTYQGLGIGFGKSIGNRINNLLPKHLRIF